MKGMIRLGVGFLLMMGGVGGMEYGDILPSLGYVMAGVGLMAWAVVDIAKESEVY